MTREYVAKNKTGEPTFAKDWDELKVLNELENWVLPEDWIFSPSQIDRYIGCPFSWFLKYGLGIREEKTFLGTVLGSYFHELMEDDTTTADITAKEIEAELWKRIVAVIESGEDFSWVKPKLNEHKAMLEHEWHDYIVKADSKRVMKWLEQVPRYPNAEREPDLDMSDYFGFRYEGHPDVVWTDERSRKVLIDYKTTYATGYYDINKHWMQLMSYAAVVKAAYIEVPCGFAAQKDDPMRVDRIYPTENDYRVLRARLKEAVRGISNRVFPKKKRDAKFGMNFCTNVCSYCKICWPELMPKDDLLKL